MKKIVSVILIFMIFLARPVFAEGEEQGIWCVTEQRSGQMIAGSREEEQRFPAGLTKLMSFLLFFEAMERGEVSGTDQVTVSRNAASKGGTSVFLDEGTAYSFEDLLRAAVVSSGNDATVALAEHIAGSEEAFVEKMTKRAGELGINGSFADATGLSPETKLSAKELAVIAGELAEHKKFFEYSNIWTYTFVHQDGRETELTSSNKLIKSDTYDGMATGSSREAGYCLAASMPQNGSRYLCIVLNAENSDRRFDLASGLLGTASAGYMPYDIVAAGAKVKTVNIPGAKEKETVLYAAEELSLLLPKDQDIQKTVHLREDLSAPLSAGEAVGELIVTATDGSKYTVPLIVKEAVEEGSLRSSLSRILRLWLQKGNGEQAV